MKKLLKYIKHIAPWVMAILIFAYLFHQYPPKNIYNSLQYMNVPFFCAVAILYVLLMFVLDTYSIARILKGFGHDETIKELLPARGLTYLIMVINYAAAQAAFAFYQYRKHGLPISKMLGIFGLIVVADLFILATLAFVTTFFTSWPIEVGGMNIASFVRIFTVAIYAGFAVVIFLIKRGTSLKIFSRLRKNKMMDMLATTTFMGYVNIAKYRLPVHIFIMGGMYLAIHTFNCEVPFVKVLSNIPLVFFIGALPITPGGLGTGNAALVALFKPFVTGEAITSGAISAGDLLFSFSLVWLFANYLMKALIGFVSLKFTSRDLFKPTSEVSEEAAEEDATPLGGNI